MDKCDETDVEVQVTISPLIEIRQSQVKITTANQFIKYAELFNSGEN